MSDEGVREIQLNGKQLVFMFMAVTVVAVVIFLCGVMVGRGVRAPRAAELAENTVEIPIDPTAALQPPAVVQTPAVVQPPAPPASDGPTSTTAAPTEEKLTFAGRLSTSTPPPETLKEPIAPVAAVAKPPAPEPAVAPAVRNTRAVPSNEPSGGGYVVQVAAVKARSEADTIAKRLQSKGFPSFVTSPSAGAARVYRVRVGKYTDRREAESVARRLEKEEQFKPWITR
jgi:cell division septation protein DedD